MPEGNELNEGESGRWAELSGRVGLATRGVVYSISAILTLRIAFGNRTTEGPGKEGAIGAVADQPFGQVLLIILALGFGSYALWRFVAAATYTGDADDSDTKVWAKRGGYVWRGLLYVIALLTTVSVFRSGGSGGGGGDDAGVVLGWPLGRYIVGAVGIGFAIAAGYNGYRAITRKYEEKWKSGEMSETETRTARVVSTIGLFGHMAVFALVGFFLVRTAVQFDPSEPEGIDQAVREVADAAIGTSFLVVLAIGMFAYAGFSFVEARWRRLLEG